MKRICEIYDVSKDYEMPIGTVLIIVSDIEKDKIISMLAISTSKIRVPLRYSYFFAVATNQK